MDAIGKLQRMKFYLSRVTLFDDWKIFDNVNDNARPIHLQFRSHFFQHFSLFLVVYSCFLPLLVIFVMFAWASSYKNDFSRRFFDTDVKFAPYCAFLLSFLWLFVVEMEKMCYQICKIRPGNIFSNWIAMFEPLLILVLLPETIAFDLFCFVSLISFLC